MEAWLLSLSNPSPTEDGARIFCSACSLFCMQLHCERQYYFIFLGEQQFILEKLATAHQCAQTLCICLMWMWEAVWGSWQQWHHGIILTPQVTQNPKIWPKYGGHNCLRLLTYAHGQHMNVLKHFVYVYRRCRKQFWVGCQPQQWHNDIILTLQVTRNPNICPK